MLKFTVIREKASNMFALMIFLIVLLFVQFIVVLAYLDKSTGAHKEPDYLKHAARDMMWNRDKIYKD